MKYFIMLIFTFLISFNVYSVDPIIEGELRIYFIDAPATWDLTFKIDAIDTVFQDGQIPNSPE